MGDYVLTPSAQADLQDIWAYIAADHPDAADSLESDVFAACQFLADQPQLGVRRPGWTDLPVRFWLVRRYYWIVFDPDSRPIQILRILHTARDISRLI